MDNMKCAIYQPAVYLIKHWDAIGLHFIWYYLSEVIVLFFLSSRLSRSFLSLIVWDLITGCVGTSKKFTDSVGDR